MAEQVLDATDAAARAGVRIAVEHDLDDAVARDYLALYQRTFAELATRAVARQVLHPEEFLDEMADPRVMKYVARDADGSVVGLSTLTKHLATVPWISPAWFARRYPEHTARDAVFYLGFTLVDTSVRRGRVFQAMLHAVIDRVLAERGVCGWDVCAHNDTTTGFAEGIVSMLRARVDVTVGRVDTQTYFTADVHGPLPGPATGDLRAR